MSDSGIPKILKRCILFGSWAVLAEFLAFAVLLFVFPLQVDRWIDFGVALPQLTITFIELSDLVADNLFIFAVFGFPFLAFVTVVLQCIALYRNRSWIAAAIAVVPTLVLLLAGVACYLPSLYLSSVM